MTVKRLSAVATALLSLLPTVSHAQEAAAGERLFRQRCAACHSIQAGQNLIGPHLRGVVGRQAGSVAGARYSAGMTALGVTWDKAQLDAYLVNPNGVVKGGTMGVSVPNAAERASLLAYLETLTPAP